MIEVKNLTFCYPGTKRKVFDQLSLTLDHSGIYGLLGKNGMGKSTLLYLLAGLLRPNKGEVMVHGYEAKKRNPGMLQDIYIVPEEYDLPQITLNDYVKIHTDFYPHFSQERLEESLRLFEMPTTVKLNQLSMGQKKKVYMSFAMASGCALLLMDEPTNGLDIPSKALFRKVVATCMPEDTTMIISTHQVHDVEQLLDHVLILDHSQFAFNASTEEIARNYTFTYRNPSQMDSNVIYAEPSLQGNLTMAHRQQGEPETAINLELLFNAVTLETLK